MSVIAPAILADTPEAYKLSIDRYHPFTQRVHIDLAECFY